MERLWREAIKYSSIYAIIIIYIYYLAEFLFKKIYINYNEQINTFF